MIAKYLDISTTHLTKETVDGLGPDKWPYSYPYEEGVFITVSDDDSTLMNQLPADLQTLLKYALDHNIQLLRLDRDAEEIGALPKYEW